MLTAILSLSLAAVGDTLSLAEAQRRAERAHPRRVEDSLVVRAQRAREAATASTLLPSLSLSGNAVHRTAVPAVPGLGSALNNQYNALATVTQSLWDGGRRSAQVDLVRAEGVLARAQLGEQLYAQRASVADAYHRAMLADLREDRTRELVADYTQQLAVARARLREGASLPADTARLAAELGNLAQTLGAARASRLAARQALAAYLDAPIADSAVLVVAGASAPASVVRQRPEYRTLTAQAALAEARAADIERGRRPIIEAFGSWGVGRPADQDFFSQTARGYGVAGVRFEWRPFDWGRTTRTAEAARLDAARVDAQRREFKRSLTIALAEQQAELARLDAAIADDDAIIAARTTVTRATRAQWQEGQAALTDFVRERTAEQLARTSRDEHRVQRSQTLALIDILNGDQP